MFFTLIGFVRMSESGQVFAEVFYCTAVFCIHSPEIELSHKLGYNAIKVSILFGVCPRSLPAGAWRTERGIVAVPRVQLRWRRGDLELDAFAARDARADRQKYGFEVIKGDTLAENLIVPL